MGKIFLAQAHYKEAERLFGECLRLQEQGGERLGMAIALVGLGQSARAQHHYEQAGILIQRALEFFTESGDRRARVWALTEHARTVQDKGDIGAALALYDQVIQESEQFNLKENLASVYTEAAALCDGLELAAKATSYRQRYESLARELQLQPWLSLITPMNP